MAEFHQIAGYDVVASLGQGAASRLYAVRDKDGNDYCLKRVVKKSPSEQRFIDQAVAEYEIGKSLDRRCSARCTSSCVSGPDPHQRGPGDHGTGHRQDLESVKFNGMVSYCKLFHAAASGLKAMHDAGFVHADIKPNNIMIDGQGKVKLIDFGQSCKNGTVKERIQGTPDYIAPEQVKRRPITPKTDIFNLGATMYWLMTGSHVPTLIPKKDSAKGISLRSEDFSKDLRPPIEIDESCPPALSNLVVDCVAPDPADRPDHLQAVMDRVEIAAGQARRAADEVQV